MYGSSLRKPGIGISPARTGLLHALWSNRSRLRDRVVAISGHRDITDALSRRVAGLVAREVISENREDRCKIIIYS